MEAALFLLRNRADGIRMCTIPMYEVLEDRSVRRFSVCLVVSSLEA